MSGRQPSNSGGSKGVKIPLGGGLGVPPELKPNPLPGKEGDLGDGSYPAKAFPTAESVIDAFFLPSSLERSVGEFVVMPFGNISLRTPVITPSFVRTVASSLTRARDDYLAKKPVLEIVEVIDQAVSRWLDSRYHLHRLAEKALPAITGYSAAMVRQGLPELLSPFCKDSLVQLLRSELGDPLVLDEFRPKDSAQFGLVGSTRTKSGVGGREKTPRGGAGNFTRAYGPRLTMHIFSGNIPAVPVASLIYALLAKSASLGKLASGEPLMASLFARTLAEVDPRLADSIAVLWWKGGSDEIEREAFARSDAVIAYGDDASLEAIRSRLPSGVRFLGYGNRISFGIITREALPEKGVPDLAARAALDVSLFDQQGCVSPHLLYVQEGGEVSAKGFARLLGEAMDALNKRLPRGKLSLEEAAAIQGMRGSYEFQELAGKEVVIYQSQGDTSWTVIYEQDPAFALSCLNRVVRVKPVKELTDILPLLEPVRPYLQTVGIAGDKKSLSELAEALGELGVSRICPIGRMQYPPAAWHHDSRPNIADLLRWVDWEG